MPHITEELSAKMGYLPAGQFLMTATTDKTPVLAGLSAEKIEEGQQIAASLYETAGRLRNLKSEYNLASSKDVKFVVKPIATWVGGECDTLATLAGAKEIQLQADYDAPQGTPAAVTAFGEVYMPLDGLIDMDAEKARLDKEIGKIEKEVEKAGKKLSNPNFIERAKPAVVEVERARLAEWEGKLEQLRGMRGALA